MAKLTKAKIENVAESLGWGVSWQTEEYPKGKTEKLVEFSKDSPAGEDFSFYVFYDALSDLRRELYTYWQYFDVEEHVEMWMDAKRNGAAGVPDVVTLVEDAKEIESMLEELYDAVRAI